MQNRIREIAAEMAGELRAMTNVSRPLLVAIDGRSGSGKSTLAEKLSRELDCCVLHMDDFFLRPEQRTEERYITPGENVDHERFLSECLLPLRENGQCVYRPFSCGTLTFGEKVELKERKLVIVEGSYACHNALRAYYDLRVFLTVSPEEQLQRIVSRNGTEKAEVFCNKWIPLEELYFSACHVPDCCQHIYDTAD